MTAAIRNHSAPETGAETEQVLITGANSGIGRALTRLFLADGARVLAVAEGQDALDRLAAELADPAECLVTRALDLAALGAAEELVAWCDAEGWRIDTLVNNAGFGLLRDATETPPTTFDAMIQLNVLTVTKLSASFGARMKARGHGAILNVGSIAGLVPARHFAAYSASKSYVNSFTFALRAELAPYGVTVTCLTPGPVATNFAEAADVQGFTGRSTIKEMFNKARVARAEEVAAAGYAGLRKGRAQVVVGPGARTALRLGRLLPPAWLPRFT